MGNRLFDCSLSPPARTSLAFAFFAAAAFLLCWPLLNDLPLSCRGDRDYFAFLYEVPSVSLYEYGEIPLWNPYAGGGMSFIGNPQIGFPSPTFLLTSLFGVYPGLKIAVWLHTFLGLWGMWLLAGHLGIAGPARFLPSFIFMFSGSWAMHLAEGHIVWLPAAFLPLLFLAYLKGWSDTRWVVAGGIVESLMLYEGGTYVFAFSLLLLTLHALVSAVEKRTSSPLKSLVWINLIAAGLAAPRLLPMLQLLGGNPRVVDAGSGVRLEDLIGSLIERNGPQLNGNNWETDAYMGVIALILYLLSLTLVRKHPALTVSSLFMFILCLGNFAPFSPWNLLHELPLFNSFQVPTRALIVFTFSAALLSGLFLGSEKTGDRRVSIILAGIVLVVGADLCLMSRSIFGEATKANVITILERDFRITRVNAELYRVADSQSTGLFRSVSSLHAPFHQIRVPGLKRFTHGAWSDQYLPLLNNRGVVDAYETLPFEKRARAVTDTGYLGEFHLETTGGTAKLVHWSPNRIRIRVNSDHPDRLVINQNHAAGWRVSGGTLVHSAGLLAVNVPAGSHEVDLRYLPASFVAGTGIFAVTAIGTFLRLRRKDPAP